MLVARLEVLGEIDARGAVRFDVGSGTTLRGADGTPIDVLIDNFSRTGFLFIADVEFPAGTLFAIGLSGAGSREAQVVWREGNRHGCEFLVPLPQSKMAKAFKGQAQVVADLEAALQRRYLGLTEGPPPEEAHDLPEPASTSEPEVRRLRLIAEIRRLLGRPKPR